MSKVSIIKSFKKTNSQIQTARELGISRQRVHQVVKGYKNFGVSGREKKYRLSWKEICQKCLKNPSVALHHKDFNNQNDIKDNLLPVCKNCHYELHISSNTKKIKLYKPKIKSHSRKHKNICAICGEKYWAKGLCKSCYNVFWKLNSK